MKTASPVSTEWLRPETPQQYHGYFQEDYCRWPRRLSRRWLKTDWYPAALFRLLPQIPFGGRVLDVGCGTGRTLQVVRRERPDLALFGTDLAAVNKLDGEFIRQLADEGGFCQADLLDDRHPLPRQSFDLAYSSNTIEHVPDGVAFLRAMAELVRPGGYALVHTMNHRGILTGFYDDPTHIRPYPPAALNRAAQMVGLDTVRAHNDRSWKILLLSPLYHLSCFLTGQPSLMPHFWEHFLAVQSVIVARKPGSCGGDMGCSTSQPAPTTPRA